MSVPTVEELLEVRENDIIPKHGGMLDYQEAKEKDFDRYDRELKREHQVWKPEHKK